jgi:hypothetical protein
VKAEENRAALNPVVGERPLLAKHFDYSRTSPTEMRT